MGCSTGAEDPGQPGWAERRLGPLIERAEAGEDPESLRDELFELLWPWAEQTADRLVARLPVSADPHSTRSEILMAVWQATRRIDWASPGAWTAMLLQRVRGAQVDAARNDDTLSRRLRAAHRRLSEEVAEVEQRQGKPVTPAERAALAAQLWPRSRHSWIEMVLTGGVIPAGVEGFGAAPGASPEDLTIEAERVSAVHHWLGQLPPAVSNELYTWLGQQRPRRTLPARLRARLRPHLAALETLLAAYDPAADAAA